MPLLHPVRSRLVAAFLFAACTRPALCADYKGTMDWECCGTGFRLTVPQEPGKRTPAKEITLQLFQGCPGRIALELLVSQGRLAVDAELCETGTKRCEKATAAKIFIDSVSKNGKHATGNFTADFPTGGHKEGGFKVKYHHEGPKPICE